MIRSRTGSLVPVGEVFKELVERVAQKRTRQKNTARLECGQQLELRFPPSAAPAPAFDPERPLADLFPEA